MQKYSKLNTNDIKEGNSTQKTDCDNCDKEFDINSDWCNKCYSNLIENLEEENMEEEENRQRAEEEAKRNKILLCRTCGMENKGVSICVNCNSHLEHDSSLNNDINIDSSEKGNSGMFILISIILIIVIGIGIFVFNENSNKNSFKFKNDNIEIKLKIKD